MTIILLEGATGAEPRPGCQPHPGSSVVRNGITAATSAAPGMTWPSRTGFCGDINKTFRDLDTESKGVVTLHDFDADAEEVRVA